jgi:hypothetical protein
LGIGLAILGALREPLDCTIDSFHFEPNPKDGHLLLVVTESSPLAQFMRNVKKRITIPRLNLRAIILGGNGK